jgi:hypothetical protein
MAVLSEGRYREGAGRVQESIRVAVGTETAARRLVALATSSAQASATACPAIELPYPERQSFLDLELSHACQRVIV